MTVFLMRRAAAMFSAFALAACVTAGGGEFALDSDAKAGLTRAAHAATAAERIRADLEWLADDAREGREAGTAGHLAAAGYVAARFSAAGLSPGAGNGNWFQNVTLRSVRRDVAAASMTIERDGRVQTLIHLEDYLIGRPLSARDFSVAGEAVFVGYGVVDPDTDYDDYRDVDLAGRIAVMFSGAPAAFESEKRAHHASNGLKVQHAAQRGAVGVIFLRSAAAEARTPWSRLVSDAETSGMIWVGPGGISPAFPADILGIAFVSERGARRLFEGAPYAFDALRAIEAKGEERFAAFSLRRSVAIGGASLVEDVVSPNVIGAALGADARRRNEIVVVTSHLDHLGVRGEGEDRRIYNGAMDNAMGVAVMTEVARRMSRGRAPRRTVVFLATTAEEKGLLGADYFAHFPTTGRLPIVANVNIDMPMLLYPFEDIVAFGAERSTLGEAVADAARAAGVTIVPDPMPERELFTRSDHYPFVRRGVPSVFVFLGFAGGGREIFEDFMRNHYHRPTDDTNLPIDYDAAARFSDLVYRIVMNVADARERPRWNKGDFFGELYGD